MPDKVMDENLQKTPLKNKTKGKKLNIDLAKCVIVLVAIAVVSGALLGGLNYLTFVDPEEVIKADISESFGVAVSDVQKVAQNELKNMAGSKSMVNNCYFVEKDGKRTYAYQSTGAGCKGGTLQLMVYVTEDGVIQDISLISQNETAGYFKRVMKSMKDKYIGIDLDDIDTFVLIKADKTPEDSSQINSVAQATYSSKGFNNALCAVAYEYQHRVGGIA